MGALARPMPPKDFNGSTAFVPAQGVRDWVWSQILSEDGSIHNPDHQHLIDADIEFMWAASGFEKQGRSVVGQAEELLFRCSAWQRGRQEQQMYEWFGRIPRFLITFDAEYCAACEDIDWCALVEHELFHIAQARNPFGGPAFLKSGQPKLEIRAHDVEEFVGVVRRYGAPANSSVIEMAKAAMDRPEVGVARIAHACGTCHLKVA